MMHVYDKRAKSGKGHNHMSPKIGRQDSESGVERQRLINFADGSPRRRGGVHDSLQV